MPCKKRKLEKDIDFPENIPTDYQPVVNKRGPPPGIEYLDISFTIQDNSFSSQKDIISSPEHEVLMVSYCGQSMSVVRRPSSVVRRAASTIALKAYSSYTPGPINLILGRKHRGDL